MKGYIYSMYKGADPGVGFTLTDPIFTGTPSLGACMPNIRRLVEKGDFIFAISGKVKNVQQYVVGGFEVDRKIDALTALSEVPENALRKEGDGSYRGNIIIDKEGNRHPDDYHTNYEKRLDNYIIGKNGLYIDSSNQIEMAREQTLPTLNELKGKEALSVFECIGRWSKLDSHEVRKLIKWMEELKKAS
ncbi:MAG: hypothetical protein M3Y54_12580 [Bacteroidota bacterium]|nr:hypothetical protein [Bacteroidota bacterium]